MVRAAMSDAALFRRRDSLSVVKIARYYDKNSATLPEQANVGVKVRDERVKWMEIRRKHALPDAATALPGRATPMPVTQNHAVLAVPLKPPYPMGSAEAVFGMGCFWGVEKLFWSQPGVYTTAVGYAGGLTPNPTYQEVCSGGTGHNEVVRVIFDPAVTTYEGLLTLFWENHNPTQGMRQGNDWGTQYRSGIYYSTESQKTAALASQESYQVALSQAGYSEITTEIYEAPLFFFAEDFHQQYLHKNPAGYCGMGGTGVSCAVGVGVAATDATVV